MSTGRACLATTPVAYTGRPSGDGHRADAGGARPPVLELHEVTKTYGSEPPVPALRGVSLTVAQGELVGIVGPSGSGKTTLLHIIGTLERPSSGTVRIDGIDIAGLDDRQLAGAARAQHRVRVPAVLPRRAPDGVGERRRRAALRRCRGSGAARAGRGTRWKRSGSRTGIAFARERCQAGSVSASRSHARSSAAPAIVLADEPTGNLDTQPVSRSSSCCEELNAQGATIIVITHDQDLASHLHRQVHMRDGLIVSDTSERPTARRRQQPLENQR